jgi:hypothetical protein
MDIGQKGSRGRSTHRLLRRNCWRRRASEMSEFWCGGGGTALAADPSQLPVINLPTHQTPF